VERYRYLALPSLAGGAPVAADLRQEHQLVEVTDPNGNRREYVYYAQSDPLPGEDAGGGGLVFEEKWERVRQVVERPAPGLAIRTELSYDLRDVVARAEWRTTVRDGRGNDTLYVLDGNGSPLRIEEPLAKTTVMTWAADDILKLSETDANGRLTELGYDDRGNLTRERIVTSDLGEVVTEYAYDPRFNKLTHKRDAEGRETRYTIDAGTGDLRAVVDAVGNRTSYGYDEHGRLVSVTDPRGHTSVHRGHDSFGNPGEVEDPLGNLTTREHDLRGRLTRQADTMGRETRQVWDGLDRVARVVRVAGGTSDDEVTETTYFPGGEVRSVRTANGAVTTYTLDGLNRVTATETRFDDQVLVARATYDANGNKETETDRRGVTRRHSHDALNRLVKTEIASGLAAEGPTGTIAEHAYDPVGNKTSETNLAGLVTRFEHDGLYRVSARILPEVMPQGLEPAGPLSERFTYDRVGNRLSASDPNGRTTRFAYDGLNRPTRSENALGHVTRIAYDDPEGSHVNKSEEHDEVRGLRTRYLYDALNRERERTLRLEGEDGDPGAVPVYTTTTVYDDAQHALTVTDPRETATHVRLDGLDREVERTVDPGGLGLLTRTAYDGLGNRKSVTDPEGRTTLFRHDGLGRLVETTDARSQRTTFEYDGEGLKTNETDRRGVARSFGYDNLGRLRREALVSAPLSGVPWSREVRYLDRERRRVEIDARGRATTLDLDGLDRVVKETDALGHFRRIRWDGVSRIAETDKRPAHHETRFEHDALDRLVKTTDPHPFTNQTVETTYDDAQNRTLTKDRRGFLARTQFDPLGRVVSVTRAVGTVDEAEVERHTWDGNGNRETTTDGEGRVTRFVYDAANRLRAREDGFQSPDAAVTTFVHDKAGNLLEERDARAAALAEPWSTKRTYDALHRLETESDGEQNVTTYGYDPEGNRTSTTTPRGKTTAFEYDELGKLTKVIQPPPNPSLDPTPLKTEYTYDENRNRILQTDANLHAVTMEYDELNRLKKTTQDPGGLNLVTETVQFDENGNPLVVRDPKGQTITSTFDELNRLKSKSYAFAPGDTTRPWRYTASVDYGYDENGNLITTDEHVASGTDPPEPPLRTVREYDRLDRLTKETQPLPDRSSREVRYTYYRNGFRKTVTDPTDSVTEYTYDGQNRLQTATTGFGTADAKTTAYTYWPDDLLKTVTYPNGVAASHGYDKADRLLTLENARGATPVSSYTYSYDPNGNRRTQVEVNGLPAPVTETTTYTYDDLDRLASVTYPVDAAYPQGRVVTYGYDAVGNRLRETEKNSADTLLADKQGVFDAANRLTELQDLVTPAESTSFTWDANGNQLTKATAGVTTENRYDLRDKLVEVVQGASTLSRFQYDAQGRRNLKIGEEGLRQYVYDQTSLLTEYDAAGLQKAKYTYGSDRLISLTRTDEPRRYFSLDGLRSVVNLTDDSGDVAASYHLSAWGEYRFPAELDASRNRFGFTGHLFDTETQLYAAKARYFDPKLGRFLTQDSFLGQIDEPPSLHRYLYAANNPLVFVDPDGNESVRQAWGLEEPQGFWGALGKNLAYNTWNAISFGTLGRQDKLVEQYEAGRITDTQYWGRTAINAGSSVAIAVAATATGGVAAGAAAGLGASSALAGAVGGVAGGLAAQATMDIVEVAGTGTKSLQEVRARDYLIAGATGGVLGGIGGAATANPTAVRFNLNPSIPGLGGLEGTFAQRGAQAVQSTFGKIAESSYQAGQRATTIVESAPPPSNQSSGRDISKYRDIEYVERVTARAARMSLNRAQATATSQRAAGRAAEELFENYAYQMQQRLMAAQSPYRITLQPAADAASGARVVARTRTSFVGGWRRGSKRLDYGFYSRFQGEANTAPIVSGGDFTVTPGGAARVPQEYSAAFPGATIHGIDPQRIVK
jgi:RHS repeat-associated protein